MQLSRRGFLLGSVSTIAATALGPLPVKAHAGITLEEYMKRIMQPKLEAMAEEIANTIIYSNPDWHPISFIGSIPYLLHPEKINGG